MLDTRRMRGDKEQQEHGGAVRALLKKHRDRIIAEVDVIIPDNACSAVSLEEASWLYKKQRKVVFDVIDKLETVDSISCIIDVDKM